MRSSTVITAVIFLFALSGCYEYEQEPLSAQTPTAAGDAGAGATEAGSTAGPSTGQAEARPSHHGATGAAHNTIEKVNERQRELEKAMEDQD